MKKEIINRFITVLGIALVAGFFSSSNNFWAQTLGEDNRITQLHQDFKITLGLDLAGGTELDYKIDLSEAEAQNTDNDPLNDIDTNAIAESVRDALEARVNPAGIGEIIVKRSQVTVEGKVQEHILIQMPPSSNVEQAKRDAEKDNRLEFFTENPDLEKKTRVLIAGHLNDTTSVNFDQKVTELTAQKNIQHIVIDDKFIGDIQDQNLQSTLREATSGSVLSEIIETQTELAYEIDENGQLNVTSLPQPVLGIVKINSKTPTTRETETTDKAEARHILLAYQGALRAGEDVPYETRDAAETKAQELLEQIKAGADFAALAQEFSTGPSSSEGGNLGEFVPGDMAPAFNDAVFEATEIGLVADLVETDFGFHIIDIQSKTGAGVETIDTFKVSYEMIAWNRDDLVWEETPLGGKQLDAAGVGYDEIGNFLVTLRFNDEGARLFGELTEKVASRSCAGQNTDTGTLNRPCRLGIKVGGNWVTTPTVQQKIIGRDSQITGNFTAETAGELANDLNLGAIDAPVDLSGQITIQPELGTEQLAQSLKAAAAGLVLTILFMIVMYRLPGVIAGIALIIYTMVFITVLKVWPQSFGGPIVLSLAGAAGAALSIGLAVDGNILIFERVKEEIKLGHPLSRAIDHGFARAWDAIRDSNLTTLIICLILFVIGSSVIKGFAIILIVGTTLSMFTAVFISRSLLRFTLIFPALQNPALFGVTKSPQKGKTKIRQR